MAIHHDKPGYGKLASMNEELSEEKIAFMAKILSETAEKEEKNEEKDGKNSVKTGEKEQNNQ